MNFKLTLFLSLFMSFILSTSCNSSPDAVVDGALQTADYNPIESRNKPSNTKIYDHNGPNETSASNDAERLVENVAEDKETAVEAVISETYEVIEEVKEEIEIIKEDPLVEDEQRDDGASMMWDNLLVKYVSADGTVDYKELKADASFALCLSTFQMSHPDEKWAPKKEKCFWINVYNAFTVKLILDNYPLKSITDLKDPWDKKFIKLKGNTYSLNQIEHEILRPKFKDPRIHFAVNCASFSCPKLLNHAFMPMSLDNMLTQMTKDFLNDPKRNVITKEKGEVSQLFDWYKEDFTKNGDLIVFINLYSKVIMDPDAEIVFMEYNWELNGK
ncbi:MAG: hypothetical protein ACI84C_002742 [Flavobacteriales bacterium]|jgi:hypothetical protein